MGRKRIYWKKWKCPTCGFVLDNPHKITGAWHKKKGKTHIMKPVKEEDE